MCVEIANQLNNFLFLFQGRIKNSQSAFNVDENASSHSTLTSSQSTLGTTTLPNGVNKHDTIIEDK